jgi:hypothetical protein
MPVTLSRDRFIASCKSWNDFWQRATCLLTETEKGMHSSSSSCLDEEELARLKRVLHFIASESCPLDSLPF